MHVHVHVRVRKCPVCWCVRAPVVASFDGTHALCDGLTFGLHTAGVCAGLGLACLPAPAPLIPMKLSLQHAEGSWCALTLLPLALIFCCSSRESSAHPQSLCPLLSPGAPLVALPCPSAFMFLVVLRPS